MLEKPFGRVAPVKEGDIFLLSCVTYQDSVVGGTFHPGATAQIVPVTGDIQFVDGVEIPGSRVKIQRPSFAGRLTQTNIASSAQRAALIIHAPLPERNTGADLSLP
jgi:hypothetical protein